MGKRSFEELSVVATGVQNAEGRFGKRRRHEDDGVVPSISPWRCNLIGLSQEHNLYFVAYGGDIYVYVPQFPTQTITRDPILIVPSQPSIRGLQGYLDTREPHTINNLTVQFLGNDEVIATVRDDGDIDAVLVRHIVQAIERRAQQNSTIGVGADEIKPIFQSNVGISAWGLAIHSEARILAVSSNAAEVRVFKFGLLQEEEASADGEDGSLEAAASIAKAESHHRKMDVTQRILNGNANIPYIAFCNTGDDPEGRWLLTTDISGYCRVMDLHSMHDADVTVQSFRFGRSYPGHRGGFDRLNAGWGIMFLDTRSFQAEKDFRAAVGLGEGVALPGSRGNNNTWDLSDTVNDVPENSQAFTYNPPKRQRGEDRASTQPVEQEPATEPVEAPESEAASGEGLEAEADSDIESEMQDATLDEGAPEELALRELDDTMIDSPEPGNVHEDDLDDDDLALVEDDEDPDNEGTEDSISFNAVYGGKRIFGNQPYFLHGGTITNLPCPILHASVKNVYLLQPSDQQRDGAGPFSPPMVGLANPLRQAIQSYFSDLNMFDRLNMNAYIPALGVVVLASQKGRAMVLSLTKLSKFAQYPEDVQGRSRKTTYAMRVECILPFAQQEKDNQRPFAPLHGIAASPIQGAAGQRRWRLIMMYQDHSTLSYDLCRRRARDSAVDVANLVV